MKRLALAIMVTRDAASVALYTSVPIKPECKETCAKMKENSPICVNPMPTRSAVCAG